MIRMYLPRLLAAAILAGSALSPLQANLISNGGFETGDFTDWIANTTVNDPWQVLGVPSRAFEGSYYASGGCTGDPCINGTASQQSSLAQTVTTGVGSTYTLMFQFNTGGDGTPNELLVQWDGSTVLDLGPGGTLGVIGNQQTYAQYTVSGLVGTGSDTLTFLNRQDPGHDQLDAVDLELASSAPEPSTWALLGAPLLLIALRRLA